MYSIPQTRTFANSDATFPRTAAMPPGIAMVLYGPGKKQLRARRLFSVPIPARELLDEARCSLPGSCHTGGHHEHQGSPPHSAGGPAKDGPGPLQSVRHPPTWMAALQRVGRKNCGITLKGPQLAFLWAGSLFMSTTATIYEHYCLRALLKCG